MVDLKDRLKEAAEGGVVDAVKNGASSMLGWLWWLIPAAGIFTYFFRDAEWMPKGLMDTLREWMGKLALWLEKTFPSLKPFLDKIFGDAAEKAAAAMSAESVRQEMTRGNKFSSEMAQALMPDDAAKTELTRIFRVNGGSIASGAAGFTPKVLAGMLTDPEGQKIITRMLPVAAAERKNPPKDSEGKVISGGADLIKNAIKGLLNDSEEFQRVARNPAAMGLLYQGAATISGVAFKGDGAKALETFFNQPNMNVEAQRTLMLAMAENPVQALSDLASAKLKPGGQAMDPTAIQNLAAAIDPASVATESRQALQQISQNGAQIITNMRQLPEPTRQAIAAGGEQAKIGVISYLASPQATPETVASIAKTASADQLPNGPMRQLLSNEAGAQSVIALGRGLGSQVFTPLATSLASGKFEVAGITAQNYPALKKFATEVVALSENGKPLAEWNNPQNAGHTALSTLRLVKDSDFRTFDAVAKAYTGMSESGRAAIARLQQANTQGQQAVVAALFDDNTRAALMTPQNRAALGTLISTLPATRNSPLARLTPQSGNTISDKNLDATLALIAAIDKPGTDTTNIRIFNFMTRMISGERLTKYQGNDGNTYYRFGNHPQEFGVTTEEVANFFGDARNTNAFAMFFGAKSQITAVPQAPAIVALDSKEGGVLRVLSERFWKDANKDERVDPAKAYTRGSSSSKEGLAQILSNKEALEEMFAEMTAVGPRGQVKKEPGTITKFLVGTLGFGNPALVNNWQDIEALMSVLPAGTATASSGRAPARTSG